MADLTFGAEVVHDGNDAAITGGIKTFVDPNDSNRKGAVVAVITADGTVLRLGQALAAASLPVVLPVAQAAALAAPVLGAGTAHIGEVALDAVALAALETITVASVTAPLAAGTAVIGKVGIDQTTPGTTNLVAAAPASYSAAVTVTRPANTTAYSANDVVGGAITFPTIGPSGGHVNLSGFAVRMDIAAVPSGMTSFRLHLYNVTPPSALADNAPWDIPSGDRSAYLGYLDLGTMTDFGSTLFAQNDQFVKKVKLTAASTTLYGYLVTAGAYTPAGNSEVYTVTVSGEGA